MTAAEFTAIIRELGLTSRGAARLLFRSAASVAAYRKGVNPVPPLVAARLHHVRETINALAGETDE